MATGDLTGNIQRLVDALHSVRYPYPVRLRELREGDANALLAIVGFAANDYSVHIAKAVVAAGLHLHSNNVAALAEEALRFSWDVAKVRPPLSAAQLVSRGYAERKLIWAVDLLRWAMRTHAEAQRLAAAERPPIPPYARSLSMDPTPSASSRHQVVSDSYVAPGDVTPAAVAATNVATLLPPAVQPYPPSLNSSTHNIYSRSGVVGGGAAGGDMVEGSDASSVATASHHALEFLSHAVALGSGAGASLVAMKKQAWYDATVTAPHLARAWDVAPAIDALVEGGLALPAPTTPPLAAPTTITAPAPPSPPAAGVPMVSIQRVVAGAPPVPGHVLAPQSLLQAHMAGMGGAMAAVTSDGGGDGVSTPDTSTLAPSAPLAPPLVSPSRLPVHRDHAFVVAVASPTSPPRHPPRSRFTAFPAALQPAAQWPGSGHPGGAVSTLTRTPLRLPALAATLNARLTGAPTTSMASTTAPSTSAADASGLDSTGDVTQPSLPSSSFAQGQGDHPLTTTATPPPSAGGAPASVAVGTGMGGEAELTSHSSLLPNTAPTPTAAASGTSSTAGGGTSADVLHVTEALASTMDTLTARIMSHLNAVESRLAQLEAAQRPVAPPAASPARPASTPTAPPPQPSLAKDALAAYLSVIPTHLINRPAAAWLASSAAPATLEEVTPPSSSPPSDSEAEGEDLYAAALARVQQRQAAASLGGAATTSRLALPGVPNTNLPVDEFLRAMAARAAESEKLIATATMRLGAAVAATSVPRQ